MNSHVLFSTISEQLQGCDHVVGDDVLRVWYCYLNRCRSRISPVLVRKTTPYPQLTKQQKIVYHRVQNFEIKRVQHLIRTCPYSGRDIYKFLTKFAPSENVTYTILNTSELKKGIHQRGVVVVLDPSYRARVHENGKQFFDCFARGVIVKHPRFGRFALCQIMFYQWASEVRLLEAMKLYREEYTLFKSGKYVSESPDSGMFSFEDFETNRRNNLVDFRRLV
jgi:hypothetical protein